MYELEDRLKDTDRVYCTKCDYWCSKWAGSWDVNLELICPKCEGKW